MSARWRDVNNSTVSLGGMSGLRGYPVRAFYLFGGDLIQANIEYRSAPLRWSFLHLGAVAFYDSGSVHSSIDEIIWRHSMGLGARILFPQFNRSVFRLDVATPLNEPGWGFILSIGSRQGFTVMPWEQD